MVSVNSHESKIQCLGQHRGPFKLIMLLSTYSTMFLEHLENHFPINFLNIII